MGDGARVEVRASSPLALGVLSIWVGMLALKMLVEFCRSGVFDPRDLRWIVMPIAVVVPLFVIETERSRRLLHRLIVDEPEGRRSPLTPAE